MENHMGGTLQLGNAQVDEADLADLCRRYRVRELSLFGSAARGDMRADSDIDMLVEFLPDAGIDVRCSVVQDGVRESPRAASQPRS